MPSTNGHGPREPSSGPSSTPVSPQTGKPAPATPWPSGRGPSGYAAREGYEVLEEVVDPGQSGASLEGRAWTAYVIWWPPGALPWCLRRTGTGSLKACVPLLSARRVRRAQYGP